MKSKYVFLAFFILGTTVFSQEQAFFNTILNSKLDQELKQSKLDSLLLTYENKQVVDSLPYILNNYAYYLFDIGASEKAIEYNYKALKILKKDTLKDKNIFQLITSDLGYYLKSKKAYKESIKFYKEAIEYDTKSDISTITYYDLGWVYTQTGDLYNAISNYKKAVNILRKLDYNKTILRSAYQNLAYLSFQIQSSESFKAGAYYGIAADSLAQLIKTPKEKNYNIQFILARLYGEKQHLDTIKAKGYYKKAFSYAAELEDNLLKARVFQGLGDLYKILDIAKSKDNYFEALKLVDSTNSILKSDLYNDLGHTYRINNEFEKSFQYRHAALELLIGDDLKDGSPKDFEKIIKNREIRDYLFHFLTQTAETYLAAYKTNHDNKNLLNKSLIYFKMSDKLVDVLREDSRAFKSRLYWREISANLYSKAIEACFLLGDQEAAFYFMEKNKGLLLLEDTYNKKYATAVIDSLQTEENRKNSELPKIASLFKVQNNLKEDEVVVMYHIPTDIDFSIEKETENGYLLGVTPNAIYFERLTDTKGLQRDCEVLHSYLRKPFSNLEDVKNYSALSFQIYQKLFPSREIQLALENKKLTIIPDDYLSLLPFEALSIAEDKLAYLLTSSEISYSHSNSFLNKIESSDSYKGFIGFAPVNFDDSHLNSLAESEQEIKTLMSYYEGTPLLYEKATKNSFLETSKEVSIMHLATHADAQGNEPAWIAFSDGKVSLEEIYNSDVSANLVVLSACNTGYGVNEPGEGIMNLARGFFFNGSKSVISSLWRIDDASTSEIVTNFYNYLSTGKTKAAALRLSKLDYIKTHANSEISPYYWASLVLWGDSDVLPTSNTSFAIYVFIFILILLTAIFFVKRKKLLS